MRSGNSSSPISQFETMVIVRRVRLVPVYRSPSIGSTLQFSEDGGTVFSGESCSGTDWAALRESFPFFEPGEPPVSGSFKAFRFCCVGLVSGFSSPESMIIISAGVTGVRIGGVWVAEPKKECRVAACPAGVTFSFFGLWERGIKRDVDGGRSRKGIASCKRPRVHPGHVEHPRARDPKLNFRLQPEPHGQLQPPQLLSLSTPCPLRSSHNRWVFLSVCSPVGARGARRRPLRRRRLKTCDDLNPSLCLFCRKSSPKLQQIDF